MTVEKMLAAVGLVMCVVLLVRGMLAPARRARLDAAALRLVHRVRRVGAHVARAWQRRGERGAATREADAAIDRARRGSRHGRPPVDREGNVLRPRSFHGRRDDEPPLH